MPSRARATGPATVVTSSTRRPDGEHVRALGQDQQQVRGVADRAEQGEEAGTAPRRTRGLVIARVAQVAEAQPQGQAGDGGGDDGGGVLDPLRAAVGVARELHQARHDEQVGEPQHDPAEHREPEREPARRRGLGAPRLRVAGGGHRMWGDTMRDANTNTHTASTKCQYRPNTSSALWRVAVIRPVHTLAWITRFMSSPTTTWIACSPTVV